jgi:hypothetical protein
MDLLEILNKNETCQNALNIFEENDSLDQKKIKIGHLRYILIIFCDCITLPTIFNDYIEANEILIQAFDQNADQTKHPDTLLAQIVSSQVENTSLSYNKYMGLSFMTCFYCSIVLETYDFDYRGRAGKLFKSWTCPLEMNEFLNQVFANISSKLENEPNAKISNYESKKIDLCQTPPQILLNDDMCHFDRFF